MPRLCPPSMQGLLSRRAIISAIAVVAAILLCSLLYAQRVREYLSGIKWPEVKVVDPGDPGEHPGDAIVLFDGKDMSQWVNGDDWNVQDGYVITAKHDIHTKQAFGDCQLHVEWAAPEEVKGSGQGRGNSGVFLMSLYELQVLDSYDNTTYPDGQAGNLQTTAPIGERLPQTRRVADLRCYFFRAEIRRTRQTRQTGIYHSAAKRRPGPESLRTARCNFVYRSAEIYGPSGQDAVTVAIPQ